MDRAKGMRRKSMSPREVNTSAKKDHSDGSFDPETVEMTGLLPSPGRSAKGKNQSLLASYNGRRRLITTCCTIALGISGTVIYDSNRGARKFLGNAPTAPDKDFQLQATNGMSSMVASGRKLQVATWNIAAINNNPFEYWITYKENPDYEKLMVKVEEFLEKPGDNDVPVTEVFTPAMFDKLDARMKEAGWDSVRSYWENDFSKRKIISGFMKDPLLGSKRLASMPDRVTNTINLADGSMTFRPTVINMYEDDLSTQEVWWEKWLAFMFDEKLSISTKGGGEEAKIPFEMLKPISRKKYPKLEEAEEKVSLPLQTMCGAIFDGILVHMMNTVSEPNIWQPLKKTMVEALNKKKVPRTLNILETQYLDSDIITLQEVSASLIEQARNSPIGQKFHIVAPGDIDMVRDQNSVVCLNKETFPGGMVEEITSSVEVNNAKGDLIALRTVSRDGVPFVVASFHGDTNGLMTKPTVDALLKTMGQDSELVSHRLVFGMDANTYEHAKPNDQQDVTDFAKSFVKHGLTSCWGDHPNPSNYTTYNARTFLQPQLNKACRRDEKRSKGDVNPKDFILFPQDDFSVVRTWKDNTGKKEYIEDMAFPTLQFPSDHGILATIIQPIQPK